MLYVSTGNLCVSQLCCCSLLDYQIGPNSQTKIHQNHKIYMKTETPAFLAQE